MDRRTRSTLTFVLCVLAGLALYRWSKSAGYVSVNAIVAVGIALTVGWLKVISEFFARLSDRLDRVTPRRHAAGVWAGGLLVVAHFVYASIRGNRFWVPQLHDEQMYLLQARQLASGILALPQHAFPEFFETFYVLTRPVYASMYFPGTALAYVPALWLDLPYIAWPLLITTGAVLMTYLVAGRLVGRLMALAVTLGFLCIDSMNWLPTMTMSHPLGALLGLTMIYAWLRWRDRPAYAWALLFGLAAGWMAITRPLESLAFGLPCGLAMLLRSRDLGWGVVARHAGVAAAVTVPFLSLQLAFNHRVTGSFAKLPITLYVETEFPNLNTMGTDVKSAEAFRSTSTLPQKQIFARAFIAPQLGKHAGEGFLQGLGWRVPLMLLTGLTNPILCILIPLSLPLAVRRPEWRVVLSIVLLYVVGYTFYGTYLTQYTIQIVPLFILLALSGPVWLAEAYVSLAKSIWTVFFLVGSLLAADTLAIMPNRGLSPAEWEFLDLNYREFPTRLTQPALLFVRFGNESNPHVEFVYNIDTPSPDDAAIVRLHDFGPARNLPILEYYAGRQPSRTVYQFDRDNRKITRLGNVKDVVARIKQSPTTRPS